MFGNHLTTALAVVVGRSCVLARPALSVSWLTHLVARMPVYVVFGVRVSSWACLSLRCTKATLSERVQGVVPWGSDKEMVRPYASGVIAMMADKGSVWDRPVGKLPRNPRGGTKTTLIVKDPVPLKVRRGHPFPAPLSLDHLRPESLILRWMVGPSGIVPLLELTST